MDKSPPVSWTALLIGVVLLLILAVPTVQAVRRAWCRRRDTTAAAPAALTSSRPAQQDGTPYPRCRELIAEALIVRERLSGHIDAATYQARMKDLALGGRR